MLNRLFIVIGVLAILAIAAAFIVPRFIQWGDYRDRMQAIASEVLGAPVEIVGDIEFSLLPQPQLDFREVRVGDPEAPTLTVAEVQAQFSLVDFLRDRYHLTRLVLGQPSLALGVDAEGRLQAGIALAEQVTNSNVSVARAEIVDGRLTVADARSGDTFAAEGIDGELRMDALRGPFAFEGAAEHDGGRYTARLATTAFDDEGGANLSVSVRPDDESFVLSAEGRLLTGGAPSFSGTMSYRLSPPPLAADSEEGDAGRGDLVLEGRIEATPARILLSEYVIVPDENRASTRLTGAADVTLGAGRKFNAVISGGVFALPPRDATADPSTLPYELVQLLHELPAPPIPAIPGTIGVDIAEVDLRAVALREVRLDATTDGRGWSIATLRATLPGNTRLTLAGDIEAHAGRPTFNGRLNMSTARLDTLSQLWRRQTGPSPLFNLPGSLEANISLVGETLSLSEAAVTIGEDRHRFEAEIGFDSAPRHLNFSADLGALDPTQSEALLALLPDAAHDPRFGVSFPKGRFDLGAEAATIAGLAGSKLVARGTWDGGVLAVETVSAEQLGGIGFTAQLTAFGSLARPELSGTATLSVEAASAPGLQSVYDAAGVPQGLRDWLERFVPADLDLRLDAPSGEGGQELAITGTTGAASVKVKARLGLGLLRSPGGPMNVQIDLAGEDATALTAQLGLGDASLLPPDKPMRVIAIIDGTAANSFETTVRIEGGGESLGFAGNLIAGDLRDVSGNGTLRATLSDLSALTAVLGAEGVWLPAINGSARVDFDGLDSIGISDISATSGGQPFTGDLQWTKTGEAGSVSGEISAGELDPTGLLSLLAGPAATLSSGLGYWPDGPAAIGAAPRGTSGRVRVTTPAILVGGAPVATDAAFDFTWDETTIRLRDVSAAAGGGRVTGEVGICCAGPLAEKQITGRLALDDVDFASLVPSSIGTAITAKVDAGGKFEGTGDGLLAALAAMTGEGSYTLRGVTIQGFDPAVFNAVTSLDDVLNLPPEAVTALVADRLDDGSFTAESVSGSFTIAGGVFRSPNLALEGMGARLFGDTSVRLADLGLSGGFAMSPTVPAGPDGMLTEANAEVSASFAGTVPAPERTFDVAGMVDTIMFNAYEMEVARLEQLRAEDEARQRAAAQERARMAAEVAARRAAEEEARRAAEEQAAREAAEAAELERQRLEEERLAAERAEAERLEAERLEAERLEAERLEAERLEAERRAAEEAAAAEAEQQGPTQQPLQPGFNLNFTPAPGNQF